MCIDIVCERISISSDSKDDERGGAELRSRVSHLADPPAVRRADRAGGHPAGAQQHEAHAEDILLQAARQFPGQGPDHAGRRHVEGAPEGFAARLPPPRAREIRRDVRRMRRPSGRQAGREGRRGYKRHRVHQ